MRWTPPKPRWLHRPTADNDLGTKNKLRAWFDKNERVMIGVGSIATAIIAAFNIVLYFSPDYARQNIELLSQSLNFSDQIRVKSAQLEERQRQLADKQRLLEKLAAETRFLHQHNIDLATQNDLLGKDIAAKSLKYAKLGDEMVRVTGRNRALVATQARLATASQELSRNLVSQLVAFQVSRALPNANNPFEPAIFSTIYDDTDPEIQTDLSRLKSEDVVFRFVISDADNTQGNTKCRLGAKQFLIGIAQGHNEAGEVQAPVPLRMEDSNLFKTVCKALNSHLWGGTVGEGTGGQKEWVAYEFYESLRGPFQLVFFPSKIGKRPWEDVSLRFYWIPMLVYVRKQAGSPQPHLPMSEDALYQAISSDVPYDKVIAAVRTESDSNGWPAFGVEMEKLMRDWLSYLQANTMMVQSERQSILDPKTGLPRLALARTTLDQIRADPGVLEEGLVDDFALHAKCLAEEFAVRKGYITADAPPDLSACLVTNAITYSLKGASDIPSK